MAGQYMGVPLTSQDGFDDLHASDACYVRHHVRQTQIHLCERLLHMLHMHRIALHQHLPLPHVPTQRANLIRRPKRRVQQSHHVQILYPLAVQHIALAPRNVFHSPRINQLHLEASPLQIFVKRYPVNACAFHRDCCYAALLQPISQLHHVPRKYSELLHQCLVSPFRHRYEIRVGPHIYSGRIQIHSLQLNRQHRLLGASPYFPFCIKLLSKIQQNMRSTRECLCLNLPNGIVTTSAATSPMTNSQLSLDQTSARAQGTSAVTASLPRIPLLYTNPWLDHTPNRVSS